MSYSSSFDRSLCHKVCESHNGTGLHPSPQHGMDGTHDDKMYILFQRGFWSHQQGFLLDPKFLGPSANCNNNVLVRRPDNNLSRYPCLWSEPITHRGGFGANYEGLEIRVLMKKAVVASWLVGVSMMAVGAVLKV